MLPEAVWIPLALFTTLLLFVSLHALAASGQFPREHRAPALMSGGGAIVLYGTIAVALISLLAALFAAWRLIPWYAAVIGGGLAILAAPLVLQQFTDRFCRWAHFARELRRRRRPARISFGLFSWEVVT